MANVLTVDEATINSESMADFVRRSRVILAEIDSEKESFKNLVKEIEDETKLNKRVISKFLKSRYNFKTGELVKEANLLGQLNAAVDG